MGSVCFSDLTKFIHELQQGRRFLDRRLVRMAEIDNEGFWCSPIHRKHVIATARVGQDIIRFDLFYGPSSGDSEHDRILSQSIARDLARLRKVCRNLKLKVRRGILEETMVM